MLYLDHNIHVICYIKFFFKNTIFQKENFNFESFENIMENGGFAPQEQMLHSS